MARPPGGESLADVTGRVHEFLNALFRDHAGQKIMIVTHAGTLRCFRFLLEGWTYSQAHRWPDGDSPRGGPFEPIPRELGRASLKVRMPFDAQNPIVK